MLECLLSSFPPARTWRRSSRAGRLLAGVPSIVISAGSPPSLPLASRPTLRCATLYRHPLRLAFLFMRASVQMRPELAPAQQAVFNQCQAPAPRWRRVYLTTSREHHFALRLPRRSGRPAHLGYFSALQSSVAAPRLYGSYCDGIFDKKTTIKHLTNPSPGCIFECRIN